MPRKNTRKKFAVALVAILIATIFILVELPAAHILSQALLPGAEGAKVGVYSAQNPYTGQAYVLGRDTPAGAGAWSPDPYNFRYDPNDPNKGLPDFYIDMSKISSEGERAQSVDYWLHMSDGSWIHESGFVESLYFNIVFRAEPSAGATWPSPDYAPDGSSEFENNWRSGQFWFATGPTIWDMAYPDPSMPNMTGHVWASPLSAYVIGSQIADNSGSSIYLTPEAYAGRQVTLFSSPAGGNIVDIISNQNVTNSNLNQTLLNNWGGVSPDTRMRSGIGFFSFQPTDFGVSPNWWYTWNWLSRQLGYKTPKIQYDIKIYYLVVGQWVYTQYEYETWVLGQAKNYQPKGLIQQLGDWWANPVNSLNTLLTIGIIVIVAVVILVTIFNPGIWFALAARKKPTTTSS